MIHVKPIKHLGHRTEALMGLNAQSLVVSLGACLPSQTTYLAGIHKSELCCINFKLRGFLGFFAGRGDAFSRFEGVKEHSRNSVHSDCEPDNREFIGNPTRQVGLGGLTGI